MARSKTNYKENPAPHIKKLIEELASDDKFISQFDVTINRKDKGDSNYKYIDKSY